MGCGASANAKRKYEPAPAADSASDKPQNTTGQDANATTSPAVENGGNGGDGGAPGSDKGSTGGKNSNIDKRPSFHGDVEETAKSHEGHKLPVEDSSESRKRRSQIRTDAELWFMDAIPPLYGLTAEDTAPAEVSEERQSEHINKCIGKSKDEQRAILKEWLKNCPNKEALEPFLDEALKSIDVNKPRGAGARVRFEDDENNEGKSRRSIARKGTAFEPKQKVEVEGGAKVKFEEGEEEAPKAEDRKIRRHGTGFVTKSELRDLMTGNYKEDDSSDEEEEEEEEDDPEFEEKIMTTTRRRTGAVCAEAYSVDDDWEPPVFEKTPEQEKRLESAVVQNFMFACLAQSELVKVMQAFHKVEVKAGQWVIEQGARVDPEDDGLFVLEEGTLDVFKDGCDEPVFTYTTVGQHFGELALLYNCPRSATVSARTDSQLWSIDRNTFNMLVRDASRRAKDRRIKFLKTVELFEGLEPEDISKIADVLREKVYPPNVHVIVDGQDGNEFFLLEKGAAAAMKNGTKVLEYGPNQYFGELALLHDAPRSADVVTMEQSTVLSLDKESFQRLLGPLEDKMLANAKEYIAKRSSVIDGNPKEQ